MWSENSDSTFHGPRKENNGVGKINVNLKQAETIVCENCGGKIFSEGVILKKVNKFLTGTPEDTILFLPVVYCVNCHHVNKDLNPEPDEE